MAFSNDLYDDDQKKELTSGLRWQLKYLDGRISAIVSVIIKIDRAYPAFHKRLGLKHE